jgi:hypothetical protein
MKRMHMVGHERKKGIMAKKSRGDRSLRTIDQLKELVKNEVVKIRSWFDGFKPPNWWWNSIREIFAAWENVQEFDLDTANSRVDQQILALRRVLTSYLRKGIESGYFISLLRRDIVTVGCKGLDKDLSDRFDKQYRLYVETVPMQSAIDFEAASASCNNLQATIIEIVDEQQRREQNRRERARVEAEQERIRLKEEAERKAQELRAAEAARRKAKVEEIFAEFDELESSVVSGEPREILGNQGTEVVH